MKIAVCIKQVPDTEARLRVGKDGRWIDEEDLPFVINESDEVALEEALQIAEKQGGEVIVFSLGPERVREALRKALALGAGRAVHLRHEGFAGGDAIATGRALAAAIRREECDLVLTGSQSDDNGYGATGTVVAGLLDWPHAWLVMGVEVEEGARTLKVTREMESGLSEVFRLALPAVLEVQAGLNHPRYASLKGIMSAKKKEIAGWFAQVREKGITIVPLSLYFVGSRVKLRMALCKGKKLYDKREDKKEKDDKREMQRAMMRRR